MKLTGLRQRPAQRPGDPPAAGPRRSSAPPETTVLLVDFPTPKAAVALPRVINQPMVMQAARPAFEIRHLLRLVGSGADAVRAFTFILIVGAVLGLLAAPFRAREKRRADLAAMRVPAAIRLRLFWRTVAENLILTGAGAGLGLAAALGVAWRADLWLWGHNQILMSFAWVDGEALLVLTVLGLCALAALPAIIRAARIDVSRVWSGG